MSIVPTNCSALDAQMAQQLAQMRQQLGATSATGSPFATVGQSQLPVNAAQSMVFSLFQSQNNFVSQPQAVTQDMTTQVMAQMVNTLANSIMSTLANALGGASGTTTPGIIPGGNCTVCNAIPCTCDTKPVSMAPMPAVVPVAATTTALATTPVTTVNATGAATATTAVATPVAAAAATANAATAAQLKKQLNPTGDAQINQMIDMSATDPDVMKLMTAAARDGATVKFGGTDNNVNGFYQPGDRTITIGNRLKGREGALDTFIHEMGHAATRADGNSFSEEARNESFATIKADQLLGRTNTNDNANKIFTSTVALYKNAGEKLAQDNMARQAFAALGINLASSVGLTAIA